MQDDRVGNAALIFTVASYAAGLAVPGMIAMLIVLAWRTVSGRWRWTPTSLDVPLMALALAAVGSGLASPWRTHALTEAIAFLLVLLVSTSTVAIYVKGSVARTAALLSVWICGGVVAAIWALAQSWSSCFASLPTAALGPTANGLGTTLASTLVLALGIFNNEAPGRRWLWASAITVMLTALLTTMSRSAWLGLGAGVVTLMLVGGGRGRLTLVLGCALAVALGAITLLPRACRGAPAFGMSARPILAELRSIGSLQENRNRIVLWRTARRMAADHAALGTGFGTFTLAFARYRPPDSPDENPPTAHNIFLNFAAETGAPGLAAFAGLCAAGLLSTWRWLVRSPRGSPGRVAATAVLAGLMAFLVNQFFEGTALTVHGGFGFLALFAIGAAGGRYLAPPAGEPATSPAPTPQGSGGAPARSRP